MFLDKGGGSGRACDPTRGAEGEIEAGVEDGVEVLVPVALRLRERLEGPPSWSTPAH